jgi:hypothetical protein
LNHQVKEGLRIAFDTISKKDFFVDAVKYYLQKDTPFNLHPSYLVNPLLHMLPDSEVLEIINGCEYAEKNSWIYAYYSELPPESITEHHLKGLYEFLGDTSDRNVSPIYRDVSSLEKYNIIDESAFTKCCRIILDKWEYSQGMVQIYFDTLFYGAPQTVIQKFNKDPELLEEIYFRMSSVKECDHYGKFLKELYLVNPAIIDKDIENMVNWSKTPYRGDIDRYICFFEFDDFIDIFDMIFDKLIEKYPVPSSIVPMIMGKLLQSNNNDPDLSERQDKWIRHCIESYSDDTMKMRCLFPAIPNGERKREYMKLFIEKNPLFEDFKNIAVTYSQGGFSGSIVHFYRRHIEFLKTLLPELGGSELIEHKNHITEAIDGYLEWIESQQIDDILKGEFYHEDDDTP